MNRVVIGHRLQLHVSVLMNIIGQFIVHSIRKFPPNYLLYGIPTLMVPNTLDTNDDLDKDREISWQSSLKTHYLNKTRIDRNRKFYSFKVGELVYIENGNKFNRAKLEEVRIGPFPIAEQESDSIFVVDYGFCGKEKRLYHVSKMIPCSMVSNH